MTGSVRIDGEVTTGILGADAEWNRLLAGVAISVSEGEGTFDQPGVDSGKIESSMTAVSPYARFVVTDRLSVWGLAGWGTGDMTIVQAANENTGQPERVARTDLEMRLAALGGRGALLQSGRGRRLRPRAQGGCILGRDGGASDLERGRHDGGCEPGAARAGGQPRVPDGRRRGADAGRGARASP